MFMLVSASAYSVNQDGSVKRIPFSLTTDGHIVITAEVNGVSGNFIFDTGAGINLLTKSFADKVSDLEKTSHFYTGHRATGEQLQTDLWMSRFLGIRDYKIEKEYFAVYDLKFPLDGLISLTAFKNQPITIDFVNKFLKIETQKSLYKIRKHAEYQIPIQVTNDRDIRIGISTKVNLDNNLSLNVNLDSGAGFGVYRFSSRYMKNLGIDKSKLKSEFKPSYFKPEIGNTYYYSKVSLMSDEAENVKIENFTATFIDGLIHEGIMSIRWLGDKITIDIPNKLIVVND